MHLLIIYYAYNNNGTYISSRWHCARIFCRPSDSSAIFRSPFCLRFLLSIRQLELEPAAAAQAEAETAADVVEIASTRAASVAAAPADDAAVVVDVAAEKWAEHASTEE